MSLYIHIHISYFIASLRFNAEKMSSGNTSVIVHVNEMEEWGYHNDMQYKEHGRLA